MDRAIARSVTIEQELLRVKREIRNAQRREARRCEIPRGMANILTAIFVLTHPSTELACAYLEQKWPQWNSDRDHLQTQLQNWYGQLLATTGIDSVLNPTTTSGQSVLSKAQSFVAEFRLHSWVENANVQQGIAPLSSVVLERAAGRSTSSTQVSLIRPNMKRKEQLQWLRRWRRRWRVGFGSILARDTLPPEECRKKVLQNTLLHPFFFTPWLPFLESPTHPKPKKRVLFMAHILGPPIMFKVNEAAKNNPHFYHLGDFSCLAQATAVWRWSNFLHDRSPPGRQIVRINMDETSIRLHQVVRAGHLTVRARALKRSARSLTSSALTSQTRGMFTLVAFVSDNETIQNILPQILLVNVKHLSNVEPAATLRMHLDANTVLWTSTSAWVNTTMMCKIVELLHDFLKPYQDTYHFIFSSDGYRAHLAKPVWRALNRARIMYHLIPAKMTWALQPCDTHVFSILKDVLRRHCQRLTLASADGRLSMTLLCQALARTIAEVLRGRSWRSAFWDLGLTGVQVAVSERVLGKLAMQSRPQVSSALPTLSELQCVYPNRYILPIDEIFGWFTYVPDVPARAVPAAARAAAAAAHAPLAAKSPWAGRLRSSSSLALPDPAPDTLPKACPPPEMSSASASSLPVQHPVLPRARRLLPWVPRKPPPPPPPAP